MDTEPKQLLLVMVLPALLVALFATAAIGSPARAGTDTTTLVDTARAATERYKTLDAAKAAGYGLFHGCVSGQQDGAMGVHYVNGDLVGDGQLDASRPEALLYEAKNGQTQLV